MSVARQPIVRWCHRVLHNQSRCWRIPNIKRWKNRIIRRQHQWMALPPHTIHWVSQAWAFSRRPPPSQPQILQRIPLLIMEIRTIHMQWRRQPTTHHVRTYQPPIIAHRTTIILPRSDTNRSPINLQPMDIQPFSTRRFQFTFMNGIFFDSFTFDDQWDLET